MADPTYAVHFLKAYADLITAAGTITLALFTFTLWIITWRSLSLARKQFQAAFPPQLVVRDVRFKFADMLDKTSSPVIAFTAINRGRHRCEIVESIFRRSDNYPEVPDHANVNEAGSVSLAPGQYHSFEVPLIGDGAEFLVFATGAGMYEDQYFIGVIIYTGPGNIRRRLMFRRICRRSSPSGFVRTGDPDDEADD